MSGRISKINSIGRELLLSEAERWMLWLPVLVGVGIYLYFSLPYEPREIMGVTALSASVSGMMLMRRVVLLRLIMLAVALIAAGFTAAQFQAWRMDKTVLERPIPYTTLRGHLAQVMDTEEGMKLVIDNPEMIPYQPPKGRREAARGPNVRSAKELPKRIRLNLRKPEPQLAAGQEIRLRGGLFPLPQPALPGGYDIGRHFYFQGIGAVGYALPKIEVLQEAPPEAWAEKLAALRQRISRLVRSEMQGEAGTIADALITGEQSAIPKQLREEMSVAGIAHMLSISGLHLSLVAGIFFVVIRQLLAMIPPLALRYPIKKIAAFFALLSAGGYLALAGFPVAANRSFVMVALVLGAVIFDRQVLSMRSVAIAALIILLVSPESLMGPSFQLSFAATVAIVALYETYTRKPLAGKFFDSWLVKPWFYVTGIALTSLVAGLATTPYVILHFQQLTIYHILTNVGTSPLLSFLVMPAAILAVLGMPFGLQDFGLTLMQYGIEQIITLSRWVTGLPMAVSYVPAFPEWGIVLITFGGLWFCFWRQKWRLAGIPLILVGIASLWTVSPPDILIAPEAKQVALRLPEGGYAMIKGGSRNFTADIWAESLGIDSFSPLPVGEVDKRSESGEGRPHPAHKGSQTSPSGRGEYRWRCDRAGCFYTDEALKLSLPKRREAAAEDCTENALMISDFYPACRGENIFARPKEAITLQFTDEGIEKRVAKGYIFRRHLNLY